MTEESSSSSLCTTPEPWGRYSACGGLYHVNGTDYLYSFGGDTTSSADGRGGVVRTNFRFPLVPPPPPPPGGTGGTGGGLVGNNNINTNGNCCWERLATSPVEIGYRATATQLGNDQHVYVLFGSDRNRVATNTVYRYSLLDDSWILLNTTTTSTTTTDTPSPRWRHAAAKLNDKMVLVTGGRQGRTVHSDAWILDVADLSWTPLDVTTISIGSSNDGLPAMYRHALAYDVKRNVTWIYGGLDDNLALRPNQLWQLNMTTLVASPVVTTTTTTTTQQLQEFPPRMASHAMEYVPELDVVLLWSGTCSDESDLYVYDPTKDYWCSITPAQRPDRRDAMIWSVQYPRFYIATGDAICYNRQVLPLADVHVLDLSSLQSWEMLYKPTNVPRGTGVEPYCNGNNAGNCQPNPLFSGNTPSSRDDDGDITPSSTCDANLLARFTNNTKRVITTPTMTTNPPTLLPAPNMGDSPSRASAVVDLSLALGWMLAMIMVKLIVP